MSSSRDKEPAKSSGKRTSGIRTLSDLNAASDPDSDNPQEYYTGGEKSGMLVQDPSKGYDVDGFFDQARRIAASQGPAPNPQPSSSRTFTGTGRLLSGENVPAAPEQPVSVVHNIVFWRNGFTVDDGPLRKFDDPENTAFLESLFKSEVPKELEQADRRSPVHVNLIRRVEDCPEPEIPQVPFQGTGRTLGSSTPITEPTPASTSSAPLHSAPTPHTGIVVDDLLPSGSIQIRLADGTRMVARFNHHHTVADIRSFIDASRPGGSRSYHLQMVGFPPKVLLDASQTIEEAGLINSVLIQKL